MVVAALFAISSFFSPLISVVPAQATAPALILVGVMMLASFADINWSDLEEAVPAFFASIFMGLCYSISYGIAAGFIFYAIVKVVKENSAKYLNFVGRKYSLYFELHYFSCDQLVPINKEH